MDRKTFERKLSEVQQASTPDIEAVAMAFALTAEVLRDGLEEIAAASDERLTKLEQKVRNIQGWIDK